MTFAALFEYTPDKERIAATRPAHRTYLAGLKETGKLVVAGPLRDSSGGLIVYDTADEAEADAVIRADPFFTQGVFVKWTLYPWTPVMSNPDKIPVVPPA